MKYKSPKSNANTWIFCSVSLDFYHTEVITYSLWLSLKLEFDID